MSGGPPSRETAAARFRAAREADWAALDRIVATIERRSVRALDDDDLLALPLLYRVALSSLSAARETSLDRALVAYLEQLCARAYFQVYGVADHPARRVARFFARDWPDAVRGAWAETIAALVLTLAGAVAGLVAVAADPGWFYGIVPEALAQGRDPSADAAMLAAVLRSGGNDQPLLTAATALFTHNAQMALFAFALGFAFGAPTALLLAYNGLILGAFAALYAAKGLALPLGGWIAIHGTTELFAIVLAGAAGLRIGGALAFPGRVARGEALVAAGRAAAPIMAGVVLMLLIAGLLEGIGRQTVIGDGARYVLGGAALAGWLAYFYLPRGHRGPR